MIIVRTVRNIIGVCIFLLKLRDASLFKSLRIRNKGYIVNKFLENYYRISYSIEINWERQHFFLLFFLLFLTFTSISNTRLNRTCR